MSRSGTEPSARPDLPDGPVAGGTPALQFSVSPDVVLRVGLTVVAVLAVASTIGRLLAGDDDPLSGWLFYFVPLTNVDAEGGIPAWWSAMLLVACAAALWTVAQEVRARGDRWTRYWLLLALGFVYLSVDESVLLHERAGQKVRQTFGLDGALYFSWVVIAVPAVLLLALVMVRFLRSLPSSTRLAFIVAGALYVGGAVGLEMVGGPLAEDRGYADGVYIAVSTVEEVLEMTGITLFLAAVARHRLRHVVPTAPIPR